MTTSLLEKSNCRATRTENLSGQVHRQIKTLILCNEILPGQKLHHQELSECLGVSRTPVREALTRLVQEGYVALLPNRVFTCKEIRLQEANELYQLREALEAFGVEKAAVRIVRAHIRAGRDNVLADLKQRQAIREWRPTGTVGLPLTSLTKRKEKEQWQQIS